MRRWIPNIAAVASGTPFITSVTGGTTQNAFTGEVGMALIGNASFTITSLSRYIISGNSQVRAVRLYNNPATTIDFVAGVNIDASGATANTFKSGAITPTAYGLASSFAIVLDIATGGDLFINNNATLSYMSGIASIQSAIFRVNGTGAFTFIGSVDQSYSASSFIYT